MALIVCPECGKSVSDNAKLCPDCGYPLKKSALKDKRIIITLVIAALAMVVVFGFSNSLNDHEKLALENCKTLKNMLKNPDSFTLYDEILIYIGEEDYEIVYIPYGGTNSYGGMVQDLAIFKDNTFWGDYDYDENDFTSQREYDDFMVNGRLPYEYDIQMKDNYENFIRIDSDKIMKHMK